MDLSFKDFLTQNTLLLRDVPDKTGDCGEGRVWEIPPFDAETEISLKDIEASYLAMLEAGAASRTPADVEKEAALFWARQVAVMVKDPASLDADELADQFHTFTLRSIAEGAKGLFRYGYRADWMATGR